MVASVLCRPFPFCEHFVNVNKGHHSPVPRVGAIGCRMSLQDIEHKEFPLHKYRLGGQIEKLYVFSSPHDVHVG